MIRLDLINTKDLTLRENFRVIEEEIRENFFHSFIGKYFEISLDQAGTFLIPHKLTFTPQHVIELNRNANATWNIELFDNTNLSITSISSPLVVKAFIGTFSPRRDIG